MVYMSQMNPIVRPVDMRYSNAPYNVRIENGNHWNDNNGYLHG